MLANSAMANSPSSQTSGSVSIKERVASVIKTFQDQVINETISDDEVDDVHTLLKACCSFILRYTNSRRSVNRLPPEILRLVFLQYVQTTDVASLASGKVKDVGWPHTHLRIGDVLLLTHVCKRWREVAHDLPGLWTSIRDAHARETRDILSRANGLPLKVLVSAGKRSDWFWDICMEYGASIQELHWVSAKNHGGDLTSIPALDIKASNVVRLSLSRGASDQARYRSASILRGATANVKVLSLNGINWFPSNRFQALTHLVLSGSMPLNDLLAFMPRCPTLQTLVLRSGVALSNLDAPVGANHVRHPQLRRLSVDLDPCRSLPTLLARLDFNRPAAAVDIVMSTLKVQAAPPFSRVDIPDCYTDRLFPPSDHIDKPLTRLYLTQSSKNRKWSSLVALSDTAGIRFKSVVPLAFDHAMILSHNIALSQVTEIWLEAIDEAMFQLFVALRQEMPALQTLNLVHPERVDAVHMTMTMFVQTLRMPRMPHQRSPPPPVPTLRVVLGGAASIDRDEGTFEVLRELTGFSLFREKKNRLILRATEFPPEFYQEVLPALSENWESVVTEVGSVGEVAMVVPSVVGADPVFSSWEGWF
ncbi:uncharacterized protein TRAVEDRAFT_46838 [Trametes versicolor FP-101664 SS1]|uniref:uncharacterized protein n=1 Tax=Trametes versicolor (strain FP-101664) TaxID=717944 RepID=UPI0004622868|nr:uncharacterized protein TRAVEDRAFT_46838 [Trametes versicolor FP-101664 SS1]EIW59531.1 hypothetical protein TRAVEDRAFT_46838 [Trametes versicolor FP-101664 SS1]